MTVSVQGCKITVAGEKTQYHVSLRVLINANQLLTLSLIEGCKHELLQHVRSLPAAMHNLNVFGYLSNEEVTCAVLFMMSCFDQYNSAF